MRLFLPVVLLLSGLTPVLQASVRLPARVLKAPVSPIQAPQAAALPALSLPPAGLAPAGSTPKVARPLALSSPRPAAAPSLKVAVPFAPWAAPTAAAVPAGGHAGRDSLHAFRGRPNKLGVRFRELAAAFSGSGRAAGPAAPSADPIATIRGNLRREVASMAEEIGGRDELLDIVEADGMLMLDRIAEHLRGGAMDPSVRLRLSPEEPEVPPVDREIRVGVFPVSFDPSQWAHVLIGLQAMARLRLDKIIYVMAGDDPRKPKMTPAALRHPIGRAVLSLFEPFYEASSIAVGTNFDGETNIFRLLALNPLQRIQAFYMVGDDHYRLLDKKGNPDTLPKLEANMADAALGFDPDRHRIGVAFIEREGIGEPVPTTLEVEFLPQMRFEASSSHVRAGRFELMPFTAYDLARRQGLYGLTPPPGQ